MKLSDSGVRFIPNKDGTYKLLAPPDISDETLADIRRHKSEIVAALNSDLDFWIGAVYEAESIQGVFDILDAFRPLLWTDEQRAQMSRAYTRRISTLNTFDV